jgi:hypothetical protein
MSRVDEFEDRRSDPCEIPPIPRAIPSRIDPYMLRVVFNTTLTLAPTAWAQCGVALYGSATPCYQAAQISFDDRLGHLSERTGSKQGLNAR